MGRQCRNDLPPVYVGAGSAIFAPAADQIFLTGLPRLREETRKRGNEENPS